MGLLNNLGKIINNILNTSGNLNSSSTSSTSSTSSSTKLNSGGTYNVSTGTYVSPSGETQSRNIENVPKGTTINFTGSNSGGTYNVSTGTYVSPSGETQSRNIENVPEGTDIIVKDVNIGKINASNSSENLTTTTGKINASSYNNLGLGISTGIYLETFKSDYIANKEYELRNAYITESSNIKKQFSENPESFRGQAGFLELSQSTSEGVNTTYSLGDEYFTGLQSYKNYMNLFETKGNQTYFSTSLQKEAMASAKESFKELPTGTRIQYQLSEMGYGISKFGSSIKGIILDTSIYGLGGTMTKDEKTGKIEYSSVSKILKTKYDKQIADLPTVPSSYSFVKNPVSYTKELILERPAASSQLVISGGIVAGAGVSIAKNIKELGVVVGLKETASGFSPIQFTQKVWTPNISKEFVDSGVSKTLEFKYGQNEAIQFTKGVAGSPGYKTYLSNVQYSKGFGEGLKGVSMTEINYPYAKYVGGELTFGRATSQSVNFFSSIPYKSGVRTKITSFSANVEYSTDYVLSKKVLDLGSNYKLEKGVDYGLDLNPYRDLGYRKVTPDKNIIQGDFNKKIPFESESFGKVKSSYSLDVFGKQKAYNEAFRVLGKGGSIEIMSGGKLNKNVINRLTSAGFTNIKTTKVPLFDEFNNVNILYSAQKPVNLKLTYSNYEISQLETFGARQDIPLNDKVSFFGFVGGERVAGFEPTGFRSVKYVSGFKPELKGYGLSFNLEQSGEESGGSFLFKSGKGSTGFSKVLTTKIPQVTNLKVTPSVSETESKNIILPIFSNQLISFQKEEAAVRTSLSSVSIDKTTQKVVQTENELSKTSFYPASISLTSTVETQKSIQIPVQTEVLQFAEVNIPKLQTQLANPISPSGIVNYNIYNPFVKTPEFYFESLPGLELPSNIISGGRKKTGYVPSFSAIIFNIKGKTHKRIETGINFRPIIKGFKYFKIRRF